MFPNPLATHQMINVDFCERMQAGHMSARYPFDPDIQRTQSQHRAFYFVPLVREIKDLVVVVHDANVQLHIFTGGCGTI